MDKPNCYDCKHVKDIPGDAHKACGHPNTLSENTPQALIELLGILGSEGGFALDNTIFSKLNVKGDPTGIENGWFAWPFNFDPTWLLECDGYEGKNVES